MWYSSNNHCRSSDEAMPYLWWAYVGHHAVAAYLPLALTSPPKSGKLRLLYLSAGTWMPCRSRGKDLIRSHSRAAHSRALTSCPHHGRDLSHALLPSPRFAGQYAAKWKTADYHCSESSALHTTGADHSRPRAGGRLRSSNSHWPSPPSFPSSTY